ncbi:unnamed protein product, partial [Amoebophrya sp. A25]|eukprot:GSA25T00017893001.1
MAGLLGTVEQACSSSFYSSPYCGTARLASLRGRLASRGLPRGLWLKPPWSWNGSKAMVEVGGRSSRNHFGSSAHHAGSTRERRV